LCRLALDTENIDAANFTALRLLSGAVVLAFILIMSGKFRFSGLVYSGSWKASTYLFIYATGFSYAYISLPTATGALILFASVQFTMLGMAYRAGKRMNLAEKLSVGVSFGGLLYFLMPSLTQTNVSTDNVWGMALMLFAGMAWGFYSLAGAKSANPMGDTAVNFLRLIPIASFILFLSPEFSGLSQAGVFYAIASGAFASGLGYSLWYLVLPRLNTSIAAICQLSVPLWAALGGVLWVNEGIDTHLVLSGSLILGGILLLVLSKPRNPIET
jgi:drug/metabolite transporter (DMT)-like permease